MALPTLLAVSHGTSNADGARDIAALISEVAAALPGVPVRSAFVDVQYPRVDAALADLTGPVVVVPLLLSRGFHVNHDLHGAAAHRPEVVVADALGPDPLLADVLAERIADDSDSDAPVILAVAGSRDPQSLTDAEGMADLFSRRLRRPVSPAYLAAREPTLAQARARHPDAAVATFLLAKGYFYDLTVRQAAPAAPSLPLLDGGAVPGALRDLVIQRYLTAARPN